MQILLFVCILHASLSGSDGWQCHAQVKAQDIVGSMKADKQNLRMEELDLLFQTPNFEAETS